MVFSSACEKITLFSNAEEGWKVLLTNSGQTQKRGPKETDAGNLYAFAHQAYWGFRFLAEQKRCLWRQIIAGNTVSSIQDVGKACSQPLAMTGAGYGATGMMEHLSKSLVAVQVLKAKQHRRFPASERPSSEYRRKIFLGIAVAAGIWEIEFATALRKLAQAGLGIDHMTREVHRFDRMQENMRKMAVVWAEPLGNYFHHSGKKWLQVGDLPCKVPTNCHTGFILYGSGATGFQSAYSPTLPTELVAWLASQEKNRLASLKSARGQPPSDVPPTNAVAPNSLRCRCGAEITAGTRELALKALKAHEHNVHRKMIK